MLLYNVACCDVQNSASIPPLLPGNTPHHSSSPQNFRLVLVYECRFLLFFFCVCFPSAWWRACSGLLGAVASTAVDLRQAAL